MARCSRCRCRFRVPPGEELDHPCPRCGLGIEDNKEGEDDGEDKGDARRSD